MAVRAEHSAHIRPTPIPCRCRSAGGIAVLSIEIAIGSTVVDEARQATWLEPAIAARFSRSPNWGWPQVARTPTMHGDLSVTNQYAVSAEYGPVCGHRRYKRARDVLS